MEFTKNKNEIKENLKQKIGPLIFCTNLYIPLNLKYVFILQRKIKSSLSAVL